jgi:cytochrome c-type biogenesis protein CcmH/NrfF
MFRQQIVAMLEAGQTRQQIIDHYVKEYGGLYVLGAPPDEGFFRLAWALPYGLGLAGAGALAFTAWRFSQRSKAAAAPPAAQESAAASDPDLEDRLDDELSRVDP